VLICRFCEDGSGILIVESVAAPWRSLLGYQIQVSCFTNQQIEQYRQGQIEAIKDIQSTALHPCYMNLLASFQVRAYLGVPLVFEQKLWGMLMAQHCQSQHCWQQVEIDWLKQLGVQLEMAVQQAELHDQVQCLNTHLESQMQERTAQLQQALNFEALVRRITEKVRDSLDESYILQTATQELAQLLKLDRCKIDLYDSQHTTATVAYEYSTSLPLCQGRARKITDFPELYQQLLDKQPLQFVEIVPDWNPNLIAVTRLACPIFDDQGIFGNLWLVRPKEAIFDEFEIRLVQQVANECAIAIRQARLYQAAQSQVRELEKLSRLKNEFLKTLSHELRTPMASINLAVQTLEAILEREGILAQKLPKVTHLFQILHRECQRESKLINDLLALSYLEAETEPLTLMVVDLKAWMPPLVQSFEERAGGQQQQLNLVIPPNLPSLLTNRADLERILQELLTNACKYTPPGEIITVSAQATVSMIQISVSNSGIEIATEELSRIFEAFYRIPNHDPWQYGGMGMGLALVQKLVRRLGASIQVESRAGQTIFTVQFPKTLNPE
jgi:signal transduction histidine kinase